MAPGSPTFWLRCGILLVAWCISRFARYSSSPGSLYSYAAMILPPWLAATAAWSLLLAYIMGSASNIGAFYYYANMTLHNATGHALSTLLLATIFAAPFIWMAWRDVKISARSMLVMEAVSVTAVVAVMALVLFRHGLHGDPNQIHLRGVTPSGFRQGLVLALYSFVGFEAATALGSEARNPLKAIPRAVILTSVLGGVFFTICAYTEILGFGHERKRSRDLRRAHARACGRRRHARARVVDRPRGARELVRGEPGGHHGRRPRVAADVAQRTHAQLPAEHACAKRNADRRDARHGSRCVSSGRHPCRSKGTSGVDVYGWLGMLAVYGFVVSYGLVCFALPGYLRDHHGVVNLATRTIPYIACLAMVYAVVANLYPVPEGVYGKLPYVYLSYLAVVLLFFVFRSRAKPAVQEET